MNALSLGVMATAFQLFWFLIVLVVLAFLIRLYLKTRLSGFVWLLVALVVWPTISRLSLTFMPMAFAALHSGAMDIAEMSVVLGGVESLIGAVLLLVAVVLLDRQMAARTAVPLSAPPGLPPYPPRP